MKDWDVCNRSFANIGYEKHFEKNRNNRFDIIKIVLYFLNLNVVTQRSFCCGMASIYNYLNICQLMSDRIFFSTLFLFPA